MAGVAGVKGLSRPLTSEVREDSLEGRCERCRAWFPPWGRAAACAVGLPLGWRLQRLLPHTEEQASTRRQRQQRQRVSTDSSNVFLLWGGVRRPVALVAGGGLVFSCAGGQCRLAGQSARTSCQMAGSTGTPCAMFSVRARRTCSPGTGHAPWIRLPPRSESMMESAIGSILPNKERANAMNTCGRCGRLYAGGEAPRGP